MFLKKQGNTKPLKYPAITSFWDQDKVTAITRQTAIEIRLTSFTDAKCVGRRSNYSALESSQEAHGFAEWPKSMVMIAFASEAVREHPAPKPPTIGMWMYEVFGTETEG